MNEEEIKAKLTPEEYRVLREKKTEAPFSGELLKEKRDGMYKCKVCGQILFESGTKFESGSGWPSFDKAISGSVEYVEDTSHGMYRIEIICSKCKSHLGHVFEGVSTETNKYYCVNSACLEFSPESDKMPE